jgi:hypothetical protein
MDRFGLPLGICSNFAKDHVPIKDHIEVVWVGTKNPYLTRSSTKNQVNELMMDNIFGGDIKPFFLWSVIIHLFVWLFLCSLCE